MRTTKTLSRLLRAAIAACVALFLLPALASPALGGNGRKVAPPKAFYLSLGDSMGFGLQFDRLFELLDAGTYTPNAFNTGYTDVLAARMQQLRPGQQTVNLSCPGESTDTMIHGGCSSLSPEPDGFGLTLHTSYAGPQLDAAVSFLQAHAGLVSPITVSIGGIDAGDVIADACNFDVACVRQSGLRESLGNNLDHILGALRAAAPDAEIILVAFHNPLGLDRSTNGLWRPNYSAVERDAAARNGVRFVDVFDIFQGSHTCQLTFICTNGDPHPTDEGYRRVADEIFQVAQ